MNTPAAIIDALGVQQIAARLDVAPKRVSRARYDDTLPAAWYVALSDMAGVDLPKAAFRFKGMAA